VESITSSKLFTTRQGTVLLGVIAAVIAAIALIVYLNNYRNSVSKPAVSVLVAKSLIQKDTPGDVVAKSGLYKIESIPNSQVKSDAFVDPASLSGKVATADVFPGQQLTSADFGAASNSITQQLARNQRAVVVQLTSPQQVGGQISAGSHVDVWVAFNGQQQNGISRPVVRELFQNMTVLASTTNGGNGNVTLQATSDQAGSLIYATENAQIWLVLRPAIGNVNSRPPTISANSLLGSRPIGIGG
jgi:Flp pilus assembly protein CpaB